MAPKAAKKKTKAKKPGKKDAALDLSGFPAESIVQAQRGLCLACTLDLFTRHMGLSAEKAHTAVKKHELSLDELPSPVLQRPYFALTVKECPYCGAPAKWHAALTVVRIEGGKATDAARRTLLKKSTGAGFHIVQEKSTERDALYHWLAKTGAPLDLDSAGWLLEAARHWLGRILPKEDWAEVFRTVRFVRRSRLLEEGFEVEGPRLLLRAKTYDEILLIQYLLSRSHKAGGLTFEGRMTLQDLFHRLRGYRRELGVAAHNPADALEQIVEILGGEGKVKFHYLIDRRNVLQKLTVLKSARVPKPRT